MTSPDVTPEASATAAPQPAKSSVWEDFVDIFYAPSRVFARRTEGRFGIPLLIVVVAGIVLYLVIKPLIAPAMDAEFARQMAATMRANPQLTPDKVDAMRGVAGKFAVVGAAFSFLIRPIVLGILLWLIGKLVDARESISSAIMVATFASVPFLVALVVMGIEGAVMSPDQMTGMAALSISPARFFDPAQTSPYLMALLSRVDLFVIWATVLLAIGLAVTGKVSRTRAAVVALIVWLIGVVPAALSAARASA